ncbi:hypothetical protein EMCRGX_G010706 [Ephydatia muelleri]|eukprot:Em0006g1565a
MSMTSKRRSHSNDEGRLLLAEYFETVVSRVEDLIKNAKGIVSLLKKRIAVDRDNIKALQKLSLSISEEAQFNKMRFHGAMEAQWSSLKEQIQAEALHRSNVSSNLELQALQPLQVYMLVDLEKRFRMISHDGRQLIKDHFTSVLQLSRARERYYSCSADWESSLMTLYKEFGDNWSMQPGNKLYEREAVMCKKAQEARLEYDVAVNSLNTLQSSVFVTQLPSTLCSLQTLVENMVTVMNTGLKSFVQMQDVLLHGKQQGLLSQTNSAAQEPFDPVAYVKETIMGSVSIETIPAPNAHMFEEYPFKDQAMMVQARKIQFQCISVLTPQELQTRGQQFIKEGSAIQEGVNYFLLDVCLEYLRQPIALKEEGLFRVPGDSSSIKSMHAQFLGGTVNASQLRATVMGQRDPNNVSGLLKLHLREHPLLSQETFGALKTILDSGNNADLVDNVVAACFTDELITLTKLVAVFATLVSEPWKTDNKMTAHTLGIACGLSIFPGLEPGKAALLLEQLVKHHSVLDSSHAQL